MSDTAATDPPTVAAPPAATSLPTRRWLVRKRFWFLLLLTLAACLVLYPPPWQAALRTLLVWEARHHGCDLSIDGMEGGPFDTFHLYGLHFLPHGVHPAHGTDLRIDHAELTFAWTLPFLQRPEPSWVRQLTLDGVRGRWDLSPAGKSRVTPTLTGRLGWNAALAPRLIPASFFLHAADVTLARGRYFLRARDAFLTGSYDGPGQCLAQTLEVGGPGFDAALPQLHGQTSWQGDRLTLAELPLGHGVRLTRATLNGNHLLRRRLDWDADLSAFGGTIRGQGAVNFSRERIALEVGGTVGEVTLGPLGRLLEIPGPAVNGRVQQASFSFRGDPEKPLAAEMWLSGRATDFRWGERRWESLEMQAVVTNRRVQVHRLELLQSRNRLSLDGECSLPPDNTAAAGHWWQAGFACNVDARLEDLRDLAQLLGPQTPDLAGRMSVNGRLSAAPGTQGYNGYLNIEGSGLSVRGAPLDFLRSTLVFRGEELDVADLQATRGGDYLAGKGSLRIAGPTDFQMLARVSVDDPGVYAPAVAGLLPWATTTADAPGVRALTAGVRLEGSVLHLDQCQGEQNGGTFQMSGSVDLRDTANPVLDLALTGQQPPRAADPADADAAWRAGIDYQLTLRGPLMADGPAIQGDAQLVHGQFDGIWQLDADAPPSLRSPVGGRDVFASEHDEMVIPGPPLPLANALMQPLLRRLPETWRDWTLDLRVTSENPLPGGGGKVTPDLEVIGTQAVDQALGRRGGTVTPDLAITGTGRHPLLGGVLRFQANAGPMQASGAWYFSPDQPDNPTVSITTATDEGRRGTFFYGPVLQGHSVPWDMDTDEGLLNFQTIPTLPPFTENMRFSEWAMPALPVGFKPAINVD